MDLKLKNYSSGMQVRLAFSVAIQVEADIILIDEVLAVGDAAFQQKCFDEFTRLKEEGRTIVFVTHDMGAVERFCDRAMLMERGRRGRHRRTRRRSRANTTSSTSDATARQPSPRLARSSSGSSRAQPVAEILSARSSRDDGETIVAAHQGEPCTVRIGRLASTPTIDDPIFAIVLRNDAGHGVFAASTALAARHRPATSPPGEEALVRLRFENWLAPGRYRLTASVARAGSGDDVYRSRTSRARSSCIAERPVGGDDGSAAHDFEIERRDAAKPGSDPAAARSVADERRGFTRVRALGARRGPSPVRRADADAGPHRVQAPLLRVGARLRCGR